MSWRDELTTFIKSSIHQVEKRADQWRQQRRAKRPQGPIDIVAFRGFGTKQNVTLTGRVLENSRVRKSSPDDVWWQNVLAVYNRFDSDEVPGAVIEATLDEVTQQITTDEEGYFKVTFDLNRPLSPGWNEVHLQLIRPTGETNERVWCDGEILVPPDDCEFGIISDIDDTVLQSHVTDWLRMVRVTLLKNAHTRLPFEGVPEFYQSLVAGSDGQRQNPLFFVSSSSWNLYDLLIDFFDTQQIPPGPLLLRDLGIDKKTFFFGSHEHKAEKIDRILQTYPQLSFILIGDSGQADPRLYSQAARKHPDRIKAIYIRDISVDARDHVTQIIRDAANHGVEMLLVSDTASAAEHALKRNLITSKMMQRTVERSDGKRSEQ